MLERAAAAASEEEAGAGAWPVERRLVIQFGDSCLRLNTDRWTHVLLEQKAVCDIHLKSNNTD